MPKTSPRIGFYSGSFDPVTLGHLDVIARAARLVDRLVIGIGVHPGKAPLFSPEEKVAMLDEETRAIASATGCAISSVFFDKLTVAAAATALLYVPTGVDGPLPVALVEHGTTGMGPGCAPSRTHDAVDALAVPFVARGFAVIAPDYAGLGIDSGMTSYLVGEREASSSLDALRAARRFRDRRFHGTRLGDEVVVVGYSQGGHAALFAHRAFDGVRDGRLLGSVSFAPALGDVRAWTPFFSEPDRRTDGMTLYAAMMLFAHATEHGDPSPSSWLSPKAQASLPGLFHDLCLGALGVAFRATFPEQRDVYAPAFQAAASRCDLEASCPDFEPWRVRLLAEQPGAFTSAAPAFLAIGTADAVVPEATVACIRDRLAASGTRARACSYAGANHGDVLARALGDALRWIDARRRGEEPDVCDAPLEARCPGPTDR